MDEGRDFFLIQCRRILPPTPNARYRACETIRPLDLGLIIPCWACGGRLIHHSHPRERPVLDRYAICTCCGRYWLQESGGTSDTITLKVSIPPQPSELTWSWDTRRDTSQSAWQAYQQAMADHGTQELPYQQWRALQ